MGIEIADKGAAEWRRDLRLLYLAIPLSWGHAL